MYNINIYILVMGLTTFAVRFLPMFLLRRQIKSTFIRSFLFYVPYVTLAVMTFPSIIDATRSPLAGGLALAGGIFAAWKKCSMIIVAMICCVIVLLAELILV
ncbi:MAG: AzlD domain-containing protein [Clostridia bacterium]|nr:AzlD domain-containing protein [Clostridia bacterium]